MAARKQSVFSTGKASDSSTSTDNSEPAQPSQIANNSDLFRQGVSNNSKVKSSLCRNFMEKGECPYGKKCQFAHGPEELKCNSNEQMAYKTKPCFSYWKKCSCTYGIRCNFQHKANQSQVAPIGSGFREIIYQIRTPSSSRLPTLLSQL